MAQKRHWMQSKNTVRMIQPNNKKSGAIQTVVAQTQKKVQTHKNSPIFRENTEKQGEYWQIQNNSSAFPENGREFYRDIWLAVSLVENIFDLSAAPTFTRSLLPHNSAAVRFEADLNRWKVYPKDCTVFLPIIKAPERTKSSRGKTGICRYYHPAPITVKRFSDMENV